VSGPLAASGPQSRTAGLCQFDRITVDGVEQDARHALLRNAQEAHRVAAHFLSTCHGTGQGEVLPPCEADAPPGAPQEPAERINWVSGTGPAARPVFLRLDRTAPSRGMVFSRMWGKHRFADERNSGKGEHA